MTSMKKVINWKTMSRSGVRLGSALSSVVIEPAMATTPRVSSRPGSGRLGGLGCGDERVDGSIGHAGRFHRHLGDAIAEEGEEEDGRDRERDAFERDEQG